MRCAMVGSGTRKARAISSVDEPAEQPQRQRRARLRRQHRMAGDEDQPQQIVADMVVERRIEVRREAVLLDLQLAADLLMLALEHLVAAQMVEGAPLGGRHQPGARPVGHALVRPLLQRRDQRLLREFLGQPDIAHDAGQPGDQLRLLDAPDRVDRAMHSAVDDVRCGWFRRQGGGLMSQRGGAARWRVITSPPKPGILRRLKQSRQPVFPWHFATTGTKRISDMSTVENVSVALSPNCSNGQAMLSLRASTRPPARS